MKRSPFDVRPRWPRRLGLMIAWLGIPLIVALVLVVLLVGYPLACSSPDSARKTLQKAGYRNIETGGYGWFACGHDDSYATKFTATNSAGQRVAGVVCCGWLKSCTVRF